jgi:hypothetical protein
MNNIFVVWFLAGQFLMFALISNLELSLYSPDWISNIIPTARKTNHIRIFNPHLASAYLCMIWFATPVVYFFLQRIDSKAFIPEGLQKNSEISLPFYIIMFGISTYAINFDWNDDLLIRLLGGTSAGFAFLGCLSTVVPLYTLRSFVAFINTRNRDNSLSN